MNRVLRRSWLRSSGTPWVALPVFIALVGVGGFLLTAGATHPWLTLAWLFAIALIGFLVGTEIVLRRRSEREYAEIATERRRAEKEAQDLFEHSTDALATVGFDGYYRRANPALVQAFGYSADELFSRPIFDLIHPDDLEPTRDAFTKVAQGEELIGFEIRHIRADGSVCWFQWNARPDLDEQVIYGVGRDVTESRRAQREFEEIFNVSPDLLCIIGFDGYFKRVNPAFEQAFGYSSEELLSRPILEFGHPDDVPRSREELELATRGKTVTQFANRNIRADGTLLWLEWSAQPLPEERIIYAAARDITERKRTEDELHGAQATVEASQAELAVYASDQAALRRVATLVAEGASPVEVLDTVVGEVRRLFGAHATGLVRYEGDNAATVVAVDGTGGGLQVGARLTLEGKSIAAAVRRTGRPARMNDYEWVPGPIAAQLRAMGVRSAVGTPITVEGGLWGVITAGWTQEEPPFAEAEARMAAFTDLVATAIANAESLAQLDVQVEQQAALRRVATLVAEDVPSGELFEAVVREVGTLLGGDFAGLARFEDDAVVTVGVWAADGEHPPVPPRWPMQQGDPATKIAESREPERWDDWTRVPGPIAEFIRGLGIRSTVGTPIGVAGRLWGALALHSKQSVPLPPDTESRMAQFTDLVATAIANREARAEVDRLAEEQAALRRVATLVAQGASPQGLFDAVAEELGRLLSVESATIGRFEPDDSVIAVASWSTAEALAFPTGMRWPTEGTNIAWIVRQTGRTARIDDFSGATDPIGVTVRESGIKSAVGSPIVVKGHPWGLITAATTEAPMPPDTEARLASFTELVATAIANAESWSELAASRARVVAASAEERRRVVRDLHDGAQQRLVHSVINMKLSLRELGRSDQQAEKHMSEALDHAEQANLELRELVYGILPGVLTSGGLRAGVEELASRSMLPVTFDVPAARLPTTIEATAYFVVSETLTNALKHSQAHSAEVAAHLDNGTLVVEVRDDGVGGADPSRGSGLTGLRDRVEALGGTIEISSPAGNGTSVTARLPAE